MASEDATGDDATVRAYDPSRDWQALWERKERFERELGGGKDDATTVRYEAKLTDDYRERYRAWVENCVEREPGCVVVATDADDRVVGYAFVLPEDLSLVWDAAVLNELYLDEDWRGTGAADALMDAAVAHARDQDLPIDRMVLDVDPDNDRASGFYEKRGFEPWAEMVAYDLS
ncbi:GNAT family N-acetyltransferase [Halomarina litorea]|uniref:GNAT family N-acetyltransferase n=1 Tax=Halomarina litorea TaxID=2961595 RepID=UPI0020C57657|nr:GNAT family N-acetyltransferase [Halomarina sp. BCD28]